MGRGPFPDGTTWTWSTCGTCGIRGRIYLYPGDPRPACAACRRREKQLAAAGERQARAARRREARLIAEMEARRDRDADRRASEQAGCAARLAVLRILKRVAGGRSIPDAVLEAAFPGG